MKGPTQVDRKRVFDWLRTGERTARKHLGKEPRLVPAFDRGYYLGRAHMCSELRVAMHRERKKPQKRRAA